MTRRDFYRLGTMLLGGASTLVLAVPGVKYLLTPLSQTSKAGSLRPLTNLSQLQVGVPQAFPIIEERQDAWVRYPREPVGSVWLIRPPHGAQEKGVAFTAECPHLGCAVNLSEDRKSFLCPCHTSKFKFDGAPENQVPPRGMDALDVEISNAADPVVSVKFERFQTQSKEKKPLA